MSLRPLEPSSNSEEYALRTAFVNIGTLRKSKMSRLTGERWRRTRPSSYFIHIQRLAALTENIEQIQIQSNSNHDRLELLIE